jgi:hypothetical protein
VTVPSRDAAKDLRAVSPAKNCPYISAEGVFPLAQASGSGDLCAVGGADTGIARETFRMPGANGRRTD